MGTWVLMFWIGFSNGTSATAEFGSKAACENAKQAAQVELAKPQRAMFFGVCVPKE